MGGMGDEDGTPSKRKRIMWWSVEVNQAVVVTGGWMQRPRGTIGFALNTPEVEFQGCEIECLLQWSWTTIGFSMWWGEAAAKGLF